MITILRGCRLLAALFLLLLLPLTTPAQSLDLLRGGGGFAGVGIRRLDIAELNSELRRFGYNTFESYALAFGGGGYALRGHLLIGGEGYGLTSQRDAGSDRYYTTSLSGGYATMNLGYLAAHSDRLSVYPMLGIGGAGVQLDIAERSSPTFEDVLQSPGRGSQMTTASFLVTLSLGADYQLTNRAAFASRGMGRVRGLVAGVRAGYTGSLASGEWMHRGYQSAAGPDIGLNGFFVTFTFGARSLTPTVTM